MLKTIVRHAIGSLGGGAVAGGATQDPSIGIITALGFLAYALLEKGLKPVVGDK
jgi:hypothetical protein